MADIDRKVEICEASSLPESKEITSNHTVGAGDNPEIYDVGGNKSQDSIISSYRISIENAFELASNVSKHKSNIIFQGKARLCDSGHQLNTREPMSSPRQQKAEHHYGTDLRNKDSVLPRGIATVTGPKLPHLHLCRHGFNGGGGPSSCNGTALYGSLNGSYVLSRHYNYRSVFLRPASVSRGSKIYRSVTSNEIQAPVAVKIDDPKKKAGCYGVFCVTYDLKARK